MYLISMCCFSFLFLTLTQLECMNRYLSTNIKSNRLSLVTCMQNIIKLIHNEAWLNHSSEAPRIMAQIFRFITTKKQADIMVLVKQIKKQLPTRNGASQGLRELLNSRNYSNNSAHHETNMTNFYLIYLGLYVCI